MSYIFYFVFSAILIILVFMSALFSFSEMAISSSSKTRLLTLLDSKDVSNRKKKKVQRVIYFTENYNEHITSIVIFNNIVNILFSTLATVFFTIVANETWGNGGYGALLSFVITTPIVIVFGEIIPKQLAKKHAESGTMLLSTTIMFVNMTMKPVTFLLSKIIKEEDTAAFTSDDEINTAISQATEAGVTTEYEQSLIKRLLSADELSVESIMVPLSEIATVPENVTPTKLNSIVKSTSHTRYPVVNKDGEVVSILSTKAYLIDKMKNDIKDLKEYAYPFGTFNLDENPFHILEGLRNRREKMAVIIDEFDKFVGIVTIEDILELLVGEIYDESDVEEDGVYQLNDDSFILDSNVKIGYWVKEYAPTLKLTPEVRKMNVQQWAKSLKGEKPVHGDSFTYKNLIIWSREDKQDKKKLVYEIDII